MGCPDPQGLGVFLTCIACCQLLRLLQRCQWVPVKGFCLVPRGYIIKGALTKAQAACVYCLPSVSV